MRPFSNDPAISFLDYHERYLIAKGQQNREMIWLSAVACRTELRKISDLTEEKNCENIFKGFMSQKQAGQIYRDLCDDRKSLL